MSHHVKSRFDHGGLKRGCRGRREHSVNAALALSIQQLAMLVAFIKGIVTDGQAKNALGLP